MPPGDPERQERGLIPANELIKSCLEVIAIDDPSVAADYCTIWAFRPDTPSVLRAGLVQEPASDPDIEVAGDVIV